LVTVFPSHPEQAWGQAVTLQLLPLSAKGRQAVYALEAEPILAEREREDVHTLLELVCKLRGPDLQRRMHAGGS
jgi:hypothetical protein